MESGYLSGILNSEVKEVKEARNYIGASEIGDPCRRKIWYKYKGYESNESSEKIKRTWAVGRSLETLVLDLLVERGVEIIRPDSLNHYLEFFDDELPYLRGHCDALIASPKIVIELKTAKNSSFNIFKSKGCRIWNERYFFQVQTYMGMSGIHEAIILVFNKDNSEISDEKITYEHAYYEMMKNKARTIHEAAIPPVRVGDSPLWWQCKGCPFVDTCHH